MRKIFVIATLLFPVGLLVAGCRSGREGSNATAGQVVKAVKVENLTATLTIASGQLKQGDQELTLAFTDASGRTVDVGAVSLVFHMPAMGSMAAMNESVTFTTSGTPGVYRGKVNIAMGGEWQGQLAYEGPAGKGKSTFSVTTR